MNFVRGAAILTGAGVLVKIIGSINRIWLSRFLGGEGIGLYQMAYPVYLLVAAVAGAGIPLAVSILVSRCLHGEIGLDLVKLRKFLLVFLLGMGVFLALAVALSAGYLINNGFIKDGRAYYGIMAIIPAILFSLLLGGLRGYYQGFGLMVPTAVSQIGEQMVRVVFMAGATFVLLPYGLEWAAAGAAGGAGAGGLAGIIILACFSKSCYVPLAERQDGWFNKNVFKEILFLAVPVSLAGLTIPLTAFLDMFLVPHCLLLAGYTIGEATTQFGYLSGMAQPLVLLTIIPVSSIVFALVPVLAADVWKRKENSELAMKLVLLVTVPASIGMMVLGEPLSELLYGTPLAGEALTATGPGIFLLGILMLSAGILQGIGKVNLPLFNLGVGVAAKVYFLLNYGGNLTDCAWATNLNYGLTAILNLVCLVYYGYRVNLFLWLKIFLSAILMGAFLGILHNRFYLTMDYNLLTVVLLVLAGIFYVAVLWLTRAFTGTDWTNLLKWLEIKAENKQ